MDYGSREQPEEKGGLLILISALDGGGAERVACRVANSMSERHAVYLMPFSRARHPYPLSDRVRVVDRSLYDLRDRSNPLLLLIREGITAVRMFAVISRFRRKVKPEVTLSLLFVPNRYNLLAAGGGRKVMSERNNPLRKGRLRFLLSRWMYGRADRVIFQSETVRNMFPERVRERGVVVPNPVEIECSALPVRAKRIVTAGRLRPQKDHRTLIEAFALFHRTHPDYRLCVYGEGELRGVLEELCRQQGIAEAVDFHPFTCHLHRDISDAEQFVLSSRFEGMPNALLEAMMMGIACISTGYEGSGELLKDEENALTVPVGDAAALARAMERLSDDEALRKRLEEGGRKTASRCAAERTAGLWESILFGT